MGTPTCVNRIVLNETERVMYGDSLGMVNMILADTTEAFKSRDLLYTEHTQDYVCLHDRHEDWVTRVRVTVLNISTSHYRLFIWILSLRQKLTIVSSMIGTPPAVVPSGLSTMKICCHEKYA